MTESVCRAVVGSIVEGSVAYQVAHFLLSGGQQPEIDFPVG